MGTKTIIIKDIIKVCPNSKQHEKVKFSRIKVVTKEDNSLSTFLKLPIEDERPHNFCTDCGTKLIQKISTYKLVVCDKCDMPAYNSIDKFCPQCGNSVTSGSEKL